MNVLHHRSLVSSSLKHLKVHCSVEVHPTVSNEWKSADNNYFWAIALERHLACTKCKTIFPSWMGRLKISALFFPNNNVNGYLSGDVSNPLKWDERIPAFHSLFIATPFYAPRFLTLLCDRMRAAWTSLPKSHSRKAAHTWRIHDVRA